MKIADILEFEDGRLTCVIFALAIPGLLAIKGMLKIVGLCKRRS